MKEKIKDLIEQKNYAELSALLKELNPADIAELFDKMDQRDVPLIFRLLPKELAADTFAYLDSDMQRGIIDLFSDSELKEVLEDSFVDDTVDMIEEMPANVVARILKNSNAETRRMINRILQYPDDSAGSIMTVEYISLHRDITVREAFARIRNEGVDKETVYTCYVTENRKLIGIVTVKDMLISDEDSKISDIMETNVIFVDAYEDKEQVAAMFSKYDFLALPVVDKEQRIIGIVTFDDAMDVLQEENTEDIEMMAAITPTDKPYMRTSVFETFKKRIPWLLLLMISATFTGKIIQSAENALAATTVLTAFIPMLMDTGGNSGSQASVTIIRGLSLGEVEMRDILRVIWKEIRVAVLCGVSLAAANFIKMMLVDPVTIPVAMVISITLVVTVILAKMVGCSLPILAKRIGFDPAVMASPFITTIVDALSLTIYFQVAKILL